MFLCYEQQKHNYNQYTNYHTPTYFDTILSPLEAHNQHLAKLHKYYQLLRVKYLCILARYWLRASKDDKMVSKHVGVWYVVGSKRFRPDIQKQRQMKNAVRDI